MQKVEVAIGKRELTSSTKKIILALQHMIAMFGATVLVPLITGFDVGTSLVCAGIGTLIFHLCTKGKVPVFLGSSFAFIPLIQYVNETYGSLRYAQGGIVVAGFIYVILSFLVKKIGSEKFEKYLPAQVVGPMIIVIGLNLVPNAINMASQNFYIAGVTLALALGLSNFAKGFAKQLSIIISVVVGYFLSYEFNLIDTQAIKAAQIIQMPKMQLPIFNLGAVLVMAPVVIAVFMEHIGDITTNSAVVGKNFLKDPGLNRTLLGDGLATMFAGLVGGPANTTYGENTGVLAITKNYDPSILRLAAVFAICLGCMGKVGGFLQTIPACVMGGISVMLFSMIAIIGVRTIKTASIQGKMHFNLKNIIIMAVIIVIGLGSHVGINISLPITKTVQIGGLSLAALTGLILNAILEKVVEKNL